jgi:hypothetical protein
MMLLLAVLTAALLIGLSASLAFVRREEIKANWSKYRDNPLYMFSAFLFKPDNDPRSRLAFTVDNFKNVIDGNLKKVFSVFLQPIAKIMGALMSSLEESMQGIMNMRGVFFNIFKKFNDVTNIFQRRYNKTFQSLRFTWTKLFDAMNRAYGVAISSLYAGVSAFRAIDNSFRLMTIVAIVILSILLGFVVFFFFILFPILPLILMGVAFIAQTPYAGEVTGMNDAFCFAADTLIPTQQGPKSIKEIKIGDVLVGNNMCTTVTATMELDADFDHLYDLHGIKVSGSHIYFEDNLPTFVRNSKHAVPSLQPTGLVYCLVTDSHIIPVLSSSGNTLLFADWEEISDSHDLELWNQTVFEMLNPTTQYKKSQNECLSSEAAVSENALVYTTLGLVKICNICPGVNVLDANNKPTRVTGVVRLDTSQIKSAIQYDEATFVSSGSWIYDKGIWQQMAGSAPPENNAWYMLFTESGSFRLMTANFTDCVLRDFSDVGTKDIPKTYTMVLESLQAAVNFDVE